MPYLMLCIGCIFLGVGVLGLFSPTIQSLDILSVQKLSEHRSVLLNQIAIFLSYIGGMPFVCFLSTLGCIYLAWYRKFVAVIFIGLGVIGSIISGWLLKWFVDRPRPLQTYHIVESYGPSFPSAHSVYAATLACLTILLCRKHPNSPSIILISCFWFLAMGISRIYAGVHFPTDVLAGWGIGFIWIALLWLWLPQTQSRLVK